MANASRPSRTPPPRRVAPRRAAPRRRSAPGVLAACRASAACCTVLTVDRTRRIGASKNGAEDIKKHKWYRGLNWAALYNKQMLPPMDGLEHVPSVSAIGDVSNFINYPTSNDENGPVLDAEKDSYLFSNWESLSKEGDVKDR